MLIGSASVGLALRLVAAVVVHFASIKSTQAKRVEHLRLAAARTEAQLVDARRENLAQASQINDLSQRLDQARKDILDLRAAKEAKAGVKGPEQVRGPKAGPGAPAQPLPLSDRCADSRDPLCGLDLRWK